MLQLQIKKTEESTSVFNATIINNVKNRNFIVLFNYSTLVHSENEYKLSNVRSSAVETSIINHF